MSKTDILGLEVPSASDKHIFSTYKDNNEIIDEAYGTSQENIAMIESHTAQSNHAIGSYFMLDNVLHKATSAIASGETITSGSNATPITLEQAITALNTSVQALQDSVSWKRIQVSTTVTILGNNTDLIGFLPELSTGWHVVGMIGYGIDNFSATVVNIVIVSDTLVSMALRNDTSDSITVTPRVQLLIVKRASS